jgi:hypothetical protein
MSTQSFPALLGLVNLWRSLRTRADAWVSSWLARRRAQSWIRHLDGEIDRVSRLNYKRLPHWQRIDQFITNAETARTNADKAYGAGDLSDVQSWVDRGLGALRSAKGLMPELTIHSET